MFQPNESATESSHFVPANGLNLHYMEQGSGPPLILLHGGTMTLHSWQEQIPIFAKHFRVLALDSRGHGKSENPLDTLSYQLLADDVAAFIEALNLHQPLVMGFSDGGQVALELGIHYPNLPGALVLGGTTHQFTTTYFSALKKWGFETPGSVDIEQMKKANAGWIEFLKVSHPRANDPDYWQTLLRHISNMWLSVQDYSPDALQQITAPTLVVLGDRDETIEVEQAVDLYRHLVDAALAILPNATHGTTFNRLSSAVIFDFLLQQHPSAAE